MRATGSVDPMTAPTARDAARVANSIAMLQFSWSHPTVQELLDRLQVPAAVGYFSIRVAPLGSVSPVVAQALMPFFPDPLVAKMVGRAQGAAPGAQIRELVRDHLTTAADEVYGPFEGLGELSNLLTRAVAACDLDGRPLAAAWSSYTWDSDAARLFGAATVLREHRGEGHWFALAAAGVSGDEAHVFSQLRHGVARESVSHGYRPEQVDAIVATLDARGWTLGGKVTEVGVEAMGAIEEVTDALDAAPWRAIGDDGIRRVVELGRSLPTV